MRLLIIDHNAVRSCDRTLYRAIQAAGIKDLVLVAPAHWKEFGLSFACEEENGPLKVIPLPVLFPGKHHRVLYRNLAEVVRRQMPDVILVNAEPENHLALQAELVRHRVRPEAVLILTTWRNIDPRIAGFPYRAPWLHGSIERKVLRSVNHIVAHTAASRSIYRSYGFENVTYIPPAIDAMAYSERPLGTEPEMGMRIGFIGRFTFLKGGDILLSALKQLPWDCRLTMVGDGEMRDTWKTLANELGIADRVRWTGGLPHVCVPALVRQFDVLVLPSRTGHVWKEQFGRVLVEAMAGGVPVIGSTSGEIPQVIGNAGIIFPENDVDALVAALAGLHHNSSRGEVFAAMGRQRAIKEFSIESAVPRYLNLLEAVVRPRL